MTRREDFWPLAALGFILAVTAGWWTFALVPVPGAPAWLERARSVCFNITETGLPDTKGWLLLIGEPPIMLGFLLVGWRDAVHGSVRRLLASPPGRAAAFAVVGLVLLGAGLAAVRVVDARLPPPEWGTPRAALMDPPRLERSWPRLEGLLDQHGARMSPERIGGAGAFVTFAFGHCETLCPVVVQQVQRARAAVRTSHGREMSVVVFTLDPWRDTPGRLGPLLAQWGLDPARDFVVGGPVEIVEAALDAWGVARTRDLRTGDIVHPGVVYLVEPGGGLAYSSTGGVEHLVRLAGGLRIEPTR